MAFQAASISCSDARAKPHIIGVRLYSSPNLVRESSRPISLAIPCTAAKSSGDAAGKPASIISTPSLANCLATSSYSELVRVAPGDCSPSLNVVSNKRT